MIDLSRIQTFLYAARYLNFSEAGRVLKLSQPTVSHHIKTLEQELGVSLFVRQGGAMTLTDAGKVLLPWAKRILRDSIEMKEMIESLKEGVAGNLTIACSTTAGKYILPQLAARFSQRFPNIKIKVLRCTPDSIIPNLLEQEANLGVVSYELPDKDVEQQKFFQDTIICIVPTNHSFVSRSTILPEDLIGEPVLMRENTSGTRKIVLSELSKFDISLEDLNIFMEIGNAEAIVRTVAAGYGISFVSRLAAVCACNQRKVMAVPIEGLSLVRTIYMVRKRLESSHRASDAFWSFIHDSSNNDLIELPGREDTPFSSQDN